MYIYIYSIIYIYIYDYVILYVYVDHIKLIIKPLYRSTYSWIRYEFISPGSVQLHLASGSAGLSVGSLSRRRSGVARAYIVDLPTKNELRMLMAIYSGFTNQKWEYLMWFNVV